jgi:hypothetical protein
MANYIKKFKYKNQKPPHKKYKFKKLLRNISNTSCYCPLKKKNRQGQGHGHGTSMTWTSIDKDKDTEENVFKRNIFDIRYCIEIAPKSN